MGAKPNVEPELTGPVVMCRPDGRLEPTARGWSRRPLHRANLWGPWGRRKRWEYWCVTSDTDAIAVTIADVDYLGLASAWWCELATGTQLERTAIAPLARGIDLPDRADLASLTVQRQGLRVTIDEQRDQTVLAAAWTDASRGPCRIDLTVARPPGHESVNVLIPWTDRRFQFTSKQNTRPATGEALLGDRRITFGPENHAFGTLDHGRGIWPYRVRWNWGSGSGLSDGRTVGLQLGGRWTEGTGFTENGICVDGHLTKLGDELTWDYDWDRPLEPWRVTDPHGRLELTLHPLHDRHSRTDAGVLSMEVHQVFGHWSGRVVTDAGEEVAVDRVVGWAEEARNRW